MCLKVINEIDAWAISIHILNNLLISLVGQLSLDRLSDRNDFTSDKVTRHQTEKTSF